MCGGASKKTQKYGVQRQGRGNEVIRELGRQGCSLFCTLGAHTCIGIACVDGVVVFLDSGKETALERVAISSIRNASSFRLRIVSCAACQMSAVNTHVESFNFSFE